ncbi:7281_t:CDS:2 [Diversispora eburnea]|uniref:7281_t:CDS:1 n=2 Tax=Diversisporales TaxID=214509 RepID=A0A9N8YUN2_9GLOM|nr:7281_t:CDS:2 [Diversispora eburnea]
MVAFSGEEENHTISFDECKLSSGTAQLVDKDGEPAYLVEFKGQETIFTVKEITTKYIASLRESAENFLGQPVTGSVLGVPTYFTEQQLEALKIAAENAGLCVLQLINEPSAAALAYELGQQQLTELDNKYQDSTVMIFDLGSDSLDVTILSIRSGMYTILSTTHDPELGGAAFDELLANHFANEFKRKTKIDVLQNKRAMDKLRNAVEGTKKTLSSSNMSPCSIESLAEGIDLHGSINRTRFEIMANKLFNRIMEVITNTLEKNDLEPQFINEVILVGGASRIPKLQSKLRELFINQSTIIRQDFEPDEVVAYGCAFQGTLLASIDDEIINNSIKTISSSHLSKPIGVINAKKEFVTIIPENTPLPVRRTYTFSNISANQKEIYVEIWEGEYKKVDAASSHQATFKTDKIVNNEEGDNILEKKVSPKQLSPIITPGKLIAELVINDLPSGKEEQLKVEFIIEVDDNNKCTIIAKESTIKKLEFVIGA